MSHSNHFDTKKINLYPTLVMRNDSTGHVGEEAASSPSAARFEGTNLL